MKVNLKHISKVNEISELSSETPAFKEGLKAAKYVNLSVLITGETGTGKEILAHYIHQNSPRANKPFITINASTLGGGLIESELFGHIKGSFTGAIDKREGLFKTADGGTIFLDEIGDLDYTTQTKFLRTLENGEIKAKGSDKVEYVDVRIIAATNVSLNDKIADGYFREDLYHRLRRIGICLKPLREKSNTEKRLSIDNIIKSKAHELSLDEITLTEPAYSVLFNHKFKGNYRELNNIIENLFIKEEKTLSENDISEILNEYYSPSDSVEYKTIKPESNQKTVTPITLDQHICIIVHNTLMACGNVKNAAACKLDIDIKTLNKYLAGYNSMVNNPATIGINPIGTGEKVMGIN